MSPSESGSVVPPPDCPAHADGAPAGSGAGTAEEGGMPLYTPEFTADPQAVYRKLRGCGRVAPVELAPGVRAWLVVDYAAALKVLRSPEIFSRDSRRWRAMEAGEVPPDSPMVPIMAWQPHALFADGEEHRRLRQVITDSVAGIDHHVLRDHVERHADRLIDGFAPAGEADLVSQYAQALPILVLGEMYGAPAALTERLLGATLRLMSGTDTQAAVARLRACAAELVALKHDRLGGDVVSRMLAHPAVRGNDEVVGALLLFIGYGGGILRVLVASGLRLLLADDRFAGDLATGGVSVEDALNELLWHDPPVANHAPHYPLRDIDFEGVRLRAGDPVLVSLAAAGTDPSTAVDSRSGNRAHLAWGAGSHTCPVQSQARLIATAAMERLLDRLPDLELAVPTDELEWGPGPVFRTPSVLPVRFPPAPTPARPGPPAAEGVSGPTPSSAAAAGVPMAAGQGERALDQALVRLVRRLVAWWHGEDR